MADVSMKDFLLQYYMQRRFNNMPPEVFAKYEDYLKGNDGKGDFRGNMKEWRDKLMHEQPAGSGKYVQNDLPDPNGATFHLSDDEWKKLYKAFRDAFRSMSASRDDFKENKDAIAFLDEYFGGAATHMFSNAVADDAIEPLLANLAQILSANPDLEYLLGGYLGDMSYSDFVSGVKNKKYNKDTKFQGVLKNVVGYLHYMKQQQANGYGAEEFQQFAPAFASLDLKAIKDGFEDKVPDAKLNAFKRDYGNLLNSVEKKKINEVFKNHDGGKITGQIEAAKSKVAYDDKESKDYVPPKRDDELTPLQQMRRWAGNTWDDVLGKYFSAHGNRVYFSPSARLIVQAIDSAKIKPTDGIDKVLSSAGDIKKGLQYKSPTATEHFDWFTKALTELKATMPKAFAGALKNGSQLKAIVAEMITMAVRDGKVEHAKTALEVLSVIKYGYTTSKIMDAMRQEELKIFSDGGLSWNKNQGMQFVTTALDKSIKAAFIGVGYGITMVGNAWRLNGSKFNGRRGRLKEDQERWAAQNAADKAAATARRNSENAADITARQPFESELTRLNRAGINDGTLAAKQAEVDRRTQRAEVRRQRLERRKASPRYVNAVEKVTKVDTLNDELEQLASELLGLRGEMTALQNDIAALDARLNDPATYAGMPAPAANALAASIAQEKRAKENELATKTTTVTNKMNEAAAKSAEYQTETGQTWRTGIAATPTGHGAGYASAKSVVDAVTRQEALDQRYEDTTSRQKEKIEQFKDAKSALDEINGRIDKRNQEIDQWDDKHKDQYMELMAYWDMLESGRDSHTGSMYKWGLLRSNKHSQKQFDKKKGNIISSNLSGYQYAA